MNIRKELESHHIHMTPEQFGRTVWGLLDRWSPGLSSDALLTNPTKALELCELVRRHFYKSTERPIPEEVILRSLTNFRKTGKAPRLKLK